MATNDATTTLSWEAESVDVQTIERELARLWQEAAAADGAERAAMVMRSSVLNLVIVTPDPTKGQRITDTLNHISGVHPSRVLTIVERRRRVSPGYDAALSIYRQADPSGSWQALREDVRITARAEAADHLLSVVEPLLIPGLPVFLWWIGEPPLGGPLFTQMVEISDRIIIDSAQFYDGAAALPALAQIIKIHHERSAFSDLNWGRLTAWRELTAQFFDAPESRLYLDYISSLKLEYAVPADGGRPNATQALFFVGWLASLLGWKVAGAHLSPSFDNALHVAFTAPNGTAIKAVLHARATLETQPANLLAVSLGAQHHRHDALFQIYRAADHQAETRMTIDGQEIQRRMAHLDTDAYERLLHHELSLFTHDPTYEQALDAAAAIMQAIV